MVFSHLKYFFKTLDLDPDSESGSRRPLDPDPKKLQNIKMAINKCIEIQYYLERSFTCLAHPGKHPFLFLPQHRTILVATYKKIRFKLYIIKLIIIY